EEDVAKPKHVDKAGDRADDLSHKLARITKEQSRDAARNSVPGTAVIARAIGKEPQSEDAPSAIDAMDGDGAYGIIHLYHVIEEPNGPADQHSGYKADDHSAHWTYEAARGSNCYQTGQQ